LSNADRAIRGASERHAPRPGAPCIQRQPLSSARLAVLELVEERTFAGRHTNSTHCLELVGGSGRSAGAALLELRVRGLVERSRLERRRLDAPVALAYRVTDAGSAHLRELEREGECRG